MKDFIYNIRRFFLHSRRRHRPGVENFGLNFRKDPVFRIITIAIFLLGAAIIVFVLLITVLPDNPVKAYVKGENLKEVDMAESPSPSAKTPTPQPSKEATPTPEPTPVPNEATPTPLVTEEEKETTTGWITAASGLVVRTGPSTQHTKLGTLPFGAKVEIIQEGTWHFIEYDGGGGYVHSNYVYIGESPPGDSTYNTNTSQTWTHLKSSTEISVEKIFYEGATYYAADIKTPVENILALNSEAAKTPGEMLEGRDTALAVNGDYFSFKNDGVIIRNGSLLRAGDYTDIAVLYENGRLDVYSDNEKSALDLLDEGALQSWSFGPILVEEGKAAENFAELTDLNLPNPRTGIGMIEPGHYIIIVADGRQESSRGLTLAEFANLFESYGCETAYNLDGGGTSVMYFENERISSPSGIEEREVSDIIYIE